MTTARRLRGSRIPVTPRASFPLLFAVTWVAGCSDATGPDPEPPLDTPFSFAQVEGTLAGVHLYDVGADGSTVLAVGMFGTILRSIDAGATWTIVEHEGVRPLAGVWSAGGRAFAVACGSRGARR